MILTSLTSLTKACKLINDKVKTRLPIHKKLLHLMLAEVERSFLDQGQEYLAVLYGAMFASAYYGLLRIGEVTSGSHPILVDDVFIRQKQEENPICFKNI